MAYTIKWDVAYRNEIIDFMNNSDSANSPSLENFDNYFPSMLEMQNGAVFDSDQYSSYIPIRPRFSEQVSGDSASVKFSTDMMTMDGGWNRNAIFYAFNTDDPALRSYLMLSSVWRNEPGDPSISYYDVTETEHPSWDINFSEFGDTALNQYALYTNATAPGDTGLFVGSKTVSIQSNWIYYLYASAANWPNDMAAFKLEFLNSSDQVVAALWSEGTRAPTLQYSNYLHYGESLVSYSTAGTGAKTYHRTHGTIEFLSGILRYTNDVTVETAQFAGNQSFDFACDALSITQVRASGTRCISTYTGGFGGAATYLRKRELVV